MPSRMFVAIVPPEPVLADLDEFLTPRREAGGAGWRWTLPFQWHLTLAFFPRVPDRCLDDLQDRLTRAAAKRERLPLRLAGGGTFPHSAAARVLWCGCRPEAAPEARPPVADELRRLAVGARAAGAKAGAEVDGGRFTPHVTLARLARPVNVARWLTVLDAYRGPRWLAGEVVLIASHLGEGTGRRPRYEMVARAALGVRGDQHPGSDL